jgi:hypothetical protein
MLSFGASAHLSNASQKYDFDFSTAQSLSDETRRFKWQRVAQTSANLISYQHEDFQIATRSAKPRISLGKGSINPFESLDKNPFAFRSSFRPSNTASTAIGSTFDQSAGSCVGFKRGNESDIFGFSIGSKKQTNGSKLCSGYDRQVSTGSFLSINDRDSDNEGAAEEEVRDSELEGLINLPADAQKRVQKESELMMMMPIPAHSSESGESSSGRKSSDRVPVLHTRGSL